MRQRMQWPRCLQGWLLPLFARCGCPGRSVPEGSLTGAIGAARNGTGPCLAGYFGTDCALSYNSEGKVEVLAGMGYKLDSRGPRVYVYDIPPEYHVK